MFITFQLKRLLPFLAVLALITVGFCYSRSVFAETISDFKKPVLIIDPGHGGEDGGAQTAGGEIESKINLDIALRLDALSGLYGRQTVMTRETQDIEYPENAHSTAKRKLADQQARVDLINAYPNAVLISIHQNCFPDTRPFGCQVLYAPTDKSEGLGKLTHEMLCNSLCPDNRRVAAPVQDSIFLMKRVHCTAILVECGFLSNTREAQLLTSDSYQTKISAVLLAAYLKFAAQSDGMV